MRSCPCPYHHQVRELPPTERWERICIWTIAATIAVTVLIAKPIHAQEDIVVRPDPVGISATRAQTNALGADLSTCLVLDGVDHLDPANHFDCVPATTGDVTDHTILVPEGQGNVKAWAVTVRTPAVGPVSVSLRSPNSKTVEDVPAAPQILSGHPAPAPDLA